LSKKLLIVAPNAFNSKSDLFPEFSIGLKIFEEKKLKVVFASNYISLRKICGVYFGIKVFRLPFLFFSSKIISLFFAFLSSLLLLALVRPNIVLINHFRSNSFFIIFWARIFHIKTILSEAGILHDDYITDNRDDPLNSEILFNNILFEFKHIFKQPNYLENLYNVLRHWGWFNVDRVLFFSKHNLYYARQIGIIEEKICYLKHYVFLDLLDSDLKKNAALDLLIKEKRLVFLIAQLKIRKGYDIFLQVAKRLVRKNLNVVFVVATSTTNTNAIEEVNSFISEHELNNNVILMNSISNDDRNYLYKKADVYFMPSRYEGFGLPAIEAGYHKAVVVASDVPALNEFLVHDYNALLFKANDIKDATNKVENALLLEKDQKNSLKVNLLKTCSEFDINKVEDLSEIFLTFLKL
jgi:glycosyltransferase involved in cell wall biosynthesis